MHSEYLGGIESPEKLPAPSYPEIAFVGRSNTGKSSLLNSLLERKNLARTSATPGRTQIIHFFQFQPHKDQTFIFCDLPGYGYATASKTKRANWDTLMSTFLQRPSIQHILFLKDIRRDWEPEEIDYLIYLSQFKSVILVFTKIDKVSTTEKNKAVKSLLADLDNKPIQISGHFSTSVIKKKGIEELRNFILTLG